MMVLFVEKYAVCAGFCAALASVFSKLALESDSKTIVSFVCLGDYASVACEKAVFLSRAVSFICIVLSNVMMWLMFTRSLQAHSTTVQPTVINTGCNFLFSSLFGWLLFGESLSLKWWAGFTLIVSGFILMTTDNKHKSQ